MRCYKDVYLNLISYCPVGSLQYFYVKSFLETKYATINNFSQFRSTHKGLTIEFKTSIVDFSHSCHCDELKKSFILLVEILDIKACK